MTNFNHSELRPRPADWNRGIYKSGKPTSAGKQAGKFGELKPISKTDFIQTLRKSGISANDMHNFTIYEVENPMKIGQEAYRQLLQLFSRLSLSERQSQNQMDPETYEPSKIAYYQDDKFIYFGVKNDKDQLHGGTTRIDMEKGKIQNIEYRNGKPIGSFVEYDLPRQMVTTGSYLFNPSTNEPNGKVSIAHTFPIDDAKQKQLRKECEGSIATDQPDSRRERYYIKLEQMLFKIFPEFRHAVATTRQNLPITEIDKNLASSSKSIFDAQQDQKEADQ